MSLLDVKGLDFYEEVQHLELLFLFVSGWVLFFFYWRWEWANVIGIHVYFTCSHVIILAYQQDLWMYIETSDFEYVLHWQRPLYILKRIISVHYSSFSIQGTTIVLSLVVWNKMESEIHFKGEYILDLNHLS